MGLRGESILLLMREGLRSPFKGRIVSLGKQDVYVTYDELSRLSQKIGYPLRRVDTVELSEKPDMKNHHYLSDRSLFAMLGFDELISIDASNYENADVIYDLNHDHLPSDIVESADVVLDAGTIEHVFHVPNSLKNIFKLLKVNGRVIHISPSSNHIDHGFYMFSPVFFFNFYSANQFEQQPLTMIRYKNVLFSPWKTAPYSPGAFDPFCGLANAMYAILCIAKKTALSSFDKIPQQFHYEQLQWKQIPATRATHLKDLVRKFPLVHKGAQYLYRMVKRAIFYRKFTVLK